MVTQGKTFAAPGKIRKSTCFSNYVTTNYVCIMATINQKYGTHVHQLQLKQDMRGLRM